MDIMADTPDPIAGARRRLQLHGIEVSAYAARAGSALAHDALESRGETSAQVAKDLFVEQVVIATAMREAYGEPPLEPADVVEFLGVSRRFLNSLWHEHP
jgi:hypothetical protein